jgi:hypothetical protein
VRQSFNTKITDPNNYDLTINTGNMKIESASKGILPDSARFTPAFPPFAGNPAYSLKTFSFVNYFENTALSDNS